MLNFNNKISKNNFSLYNLKYHLERFICLQSHFSTMFKVFSLVLITFKSLNYKKIVALKKKMINIPAPKMASFEKRPAPLLNLLQKAQYNPQVLTNNLATLKADTKPSYSKVIDVRKP